MSSSRNFFGRSYSVYLVAIIIGIFITAYIYGQANVINPDGICYLLTAKMMQTDGISSAMQLCGQSHWPFYSFIINHFASFTHFSYLTAANFWDALFSFLTICMFISIVKELGANQRTVWMAAFVIVCSYTLNNVRELVIRDHGYWAFYLCSIWLLLKVVKNADWRTAIACNAALLLATLFRIEGAIFIICMPFVIWFCKHYSTQQRAKLFLSLNIVNLCLGMLVIIWFVAEPQVSLAKLGRIKELANQFQHAFILVIERFEKTKSALATFVLNAASARDAGLILSLALIVEYIISVLTNLSWIYAALVIYAWVRKVVTFSKPAYLILYTYLFLNIIITATFFGEALFLSQRYLIALSLVLMLWVPFALNDLLTKWSLNLRYKQVISLILLALGISTVSGIGNFGHSKTYLHTAGDWIAANVPATVPLYSNDYQLMYYTKHWGNSIFVEGPIYSRVAIMRNGEWKKFDYLALRINGKKDADMTALLAEIKATPLQEFNNHHGDRVVVYKVLH